MSPGGSMVKHSCICIKSMAEELLCKRPGVLLNGHDLGDLNAIHGCFRRFWRVFKKHYPHHPVYTDHSNLEWCIPCKIHIDEGTGVRKHPILQVSWSPVFQHKYIYWSCLPHELYKAANQGWERGNPVVDSLLQQFTAMARSVYFTGISAGANRFYLVWTATEGDLPALAKSFHCKRNFGREPNECCFWCEASDHSDDMAFANLRPSAGWRNTIGESRPWTTTGGLADLPGAGHELFLGKDVFHIIHLGIARTFYASLLCYLVQERYFAGKSVDVRLLEAYSDFKAFCRLLSLTPNVKTFSRDNTGWPSTSYFPETSWKGSDTRLMTLWLLAFLDRPFLRTDVLSAAHDALVAIDTALRAMYTSHRVFLATADAVRVSELIKTFCFSYLRCAQLCFDRGQLFFNLTPKLHYCFHLALDIDKQVASHSGSSCVLNPAIYGTQVAETYIGTISQMSRTVHPASVARRAAQKFLIHFKMEHRRLATH